MGIKKILTKLDSALKKLAESGNRAHVTHGYILSELERRQGDIATAYSIVVWAPRFGQTSTKSCRRAFSSAFKRKNKTNV